RGHRHRPADPQLHRPGRGPGTGPCRLPAATAPTAAEARDTSPPGPAAARSQRHRQHDLTGQPGPLPGSCHGRYHTDRQTPAAELLRLVLIVMGVIVGVVATAAAALFA